ncbi:MAG: copper resistance protein B [Allosphingosinicella sp.]
MRRVWLALLLGATGAPALAQHAGHGAHAPSPPARPAPPPPPATEPHAGHATPAAASDPHAGHSGHAAPDPHAGHGAHAPSPPSPPAPPPVTDPPPGHAVPAATTDPHAGHAGSATPDPHAGHGAEVPAPPVAPPPAAALSGPEHAADLVHDPGAMAAAREELRRTHGAMGHHLFLIDRLELGFGDGPDRFAWEGVQLRVGGDVDRLWLKSRGEGELDGGLERAELQALWSHAIGPWFDLQTGLRYDLNHGPDRGWLVLGVQGLAPYWFEVGAAAFFSDEGEVSARLEAEYDLRITQQLILQPGAELELALQDAPEIGLAAGLSSAEVGLRLRYEIVPELAPYLGVEYERAFGDAAGFARAAGEEADQWRLVAGIRAWF